MKECNDLDGGGSECNRSEERWIQFGRWSRESGHVGLGVEEVRNRWRREGEDEEEKGLGVKSSQEGREEMRKVSFRKRGKAERERRRERRRTGAESTH